MKTDRTDIYDNLEQERHQIYSNNIECKGFIYSNITTEEEAYKFKTTDESFWEQFLYGSTMTSSINENSSPKTPSPRIALTHPRPDTASNEIQKSGCDESKNTEKNLKRKLEINDDVKISNGKTSLSKNNHSGLTMFIKPENDLEERIKKARKLSNNEVRERDNSIYNFRR